MSSECRLTHEQQAIIDWLNDVADEGGVGTYPGGAEQFRRDLVQRLDALPLRVPGQATEVVTLFYSGPLGDQVRNCWMIAESIGRESSGRVVTMGETLLGELQNHVRFSEALWCAVGADHADLHAALTSGIRADINRVESFWERAGRRLAMLTNGVRADGNRDESLWERASRRLALAAVGDVRTLSPCAVDDRLFAQVELPQLLKNPQVTHINGAPVEAYRHIYEATPGAIPDKLSAVNQAVQASSYELTREMRWREDAPRGGGTE